MQRGYRTALTLLCAALTATACGQADRTAEQPTTHVSTLVLAPPEPDIAAELDAADRAAVEAYLAHLAAEQQAREQAEADRLVAERRHREQARQTARTEVRRAQVVAGNPCGGDLPPCNVANRENGARDPALWNGRCYAPEGWTGGRGTVSVDGGPCRGTSTASGLWQITRGTWARFMGYVNAADAPAWVQNLKASLLWANGAGCGHWKAC